MKPSIRKQGGRWQVTRPPFGFASAPSTVVYESWDAARQAVVGPAVASAAPTLEQGDYTLGLYVDGWPLRGTIRMEDNT